MPIVTGEWWRRRIPQAMPIVFCSTLMYFRIFGQQAHNQVAIHQRDLPFNTPLQATERIQTSVYLVPLQCQRVNVRVVASSYPRALPNAFVE